MYYFKSMQKIWFSAVLCYEQSISWIQPFTTASLVLYNLSNLIVFIPHSITCDQHLNLYCTHINIHYPFLIIRIFFHHQWNRSCYKQFTCYVQIWFLKMTHYLSPLYITIENTVLWESHFEGLLLCDHTEKYM